MATTLHYTTMQENSRNRRWCPRTHTDLLDVLQRAVHHPSRTSSSPFCSPTRADRPRGAALTLRHDARGSHGLDQSPLLAGEHGLDGGQVRHGPAVPAQVHAADRGRDPLGRAGRGRVRKLWRLQPLHSKAHRGRAPGNPQPPVGVEGQGRVPARGRQACYDVPEGVPRVWERCGWPSTDERAAILDHGGGNYFWFCCLRGIWKMWWAAGGWWLLDTVQREWI